MVPEWMRYFYKEMLSNSKGDFVFDQISHGNIEIVVKKINGPDKNVIDYLRKRNINNKLAWSYPLLLWYFNKNNGKVEIKHPGEIQSELNLQNLYDVVYKRGKI